MGPAGRIGSVLIQMAISALYLSSVIDGKWTYFLEVFPSFAPPPLSPGVHCFDDCFPRHPVLAGWIGLFLFLLAWSVLAYSWWKPMSRDSARLRCRVS